ncbi:right-handed parallel beta-helix repeat-containing protein [Winogradskyella vincentii]|uniref:Right handed beta helix region n=1 Tax=Winogradskyella vincentii TaxID=2877122 RepID=A0ABS7Y1I7_9FLAO|nr:hypothetical protein [Winogradskyella vincentii]MCA0153811.1 hypothetical protein [Winogradskyella vincentii]
MKSLYTFMLLVLCSTISINAQKVVALHSPTNGVQYFDGTSALQDAYNAAVATDTIYLPGGTFTPPALFDKQLTIFGAGHHPDATSATQATTISAHVYLGDNADGFYLEGVNISGSLYLGDANDVSVNDIVVKRNHFDSLIAQGTGDTNTSNNNLFVENVIYSLSTHNLRSSSFSNNIIEHRSNGPFFNLQFVNNVFITSYYNGSYPIITYANSCVFRNNIFLQEYTYLCSGDGQSEWMNNIFCHSNPTLGLDPVLTSNYNMSRADVLVDQTGSIFDYVHDYHLKTGALSNLGDDGTQTGLYGGVYPWKDFSIPTNPHIVSKTISGSSDASGNIQVDITVEAQDN